jgi:hypothetical protein
MASFCVALKMSPAQYKELTLLEYTALIQAFSASKGNDLEGLL